MPASNQSSYNSTAFAAVLDVITARLRAVFTQGGFVRVVANPEGQLPQYKAEAGLSVFVSTPRPLPKNGAGRYGRNATRDVIVIVATQNLLDEAGADEIAVKAHIATEESVCNVLEQSPPVGHPANLRVGTLIEWVEGGEDIARQIKTDPGMLISALRFRVWFVQPMTVYRD